ncbi:MAG: hypothetical protein M0T70_05725 [Geobacteraceae bacterium]|nr:hypothetical protein [Geobacteraceae bacterium]
MKPSPTIAVLTLLTSLVLPTSLALALYSQPASTFSAGGGESTSTNYINLGVIGQPGVVGSSSNASYKSEHGFLPVLGGWRILYPVIATTPGAPTFTLMAGSTGGQDVTISNAGGSNLNWTVTKNITDSIFNLSQSSGTAPGTVTVTANAASLMPGNYSNTLNISGAGIDQIAQVVLDLTVTPASYTLAVTLKLATPGKGGGTVTSTVPDSSLSCQRTGGNTDVICSANFAPGTITLSQTPDSNTTSATWGVPGCGSNPSCQVVLNTYPGTGIDVIFPYSFMAKDSISGATSDSLVTAYGSAAATDTINSRAVSFSEIGGVFNLIGSKTIHLVGGLDAYYNALTGSYTTILGRLNIGGTGRVTAKYVKIHP